jgi:CHAT domain-containing protein/tetratricopeptide (TPR) repeat protein
LIAQAPGYGQATPSADQINAWLKEGEALHDNGQSAKALPILQRALEGSRKRFGEETVETAKAMSLTAAAYRQTGQLAHAAPLLRRCLAIREAKLGRHHLDTARTLNDLGLTCKGLGQAKEAEEFLRRSLGIYEAKQGKEHASTSVVLFNLAELYKSTGRYAEAEPHYLRCLQISETKQGADHPETATCLNVLADLYKLMICYAQAEPRYRRCLQIREAKLGKSHVATAEALDDLADLYGRMARWDEAEKLARRSLEIRESKLGTEHASTCDSRDLLGAVHAQLAKYSAAAAFYQRSWQVREAKLGNNHPATAQSLSALGDLYRVTGRYQEAEPLLQRAWRIRELNFGAEHATTASSLYELASLYEAMGNFAKGESIIRRCLPIRESKLGIHHPDTALALSQLATFHQTLGRYGDAERLLERALTIAKVKLGGDHPATGDILGRLARLYLQMKRYQEADPLCLRSLEINKARRGEDHPRTAASLSDLAQLYLRLRQFDKAEPLLRRGLEIRESKLGKDHPEVCSSLHGLARLYQLTNRAAEAEPLLRRSLEICEAKLSADHPLTAATLNDWAMLKISLGRDEEAAPLFRSVRKIHEAKFGPDHPTTVGTLNDLATLYAATDRPAEARDLFDYACRATRRYVVGLLPTLSPSEQRSYLISHAGAGRMALSLSLKHGAADSAITEAGAAWLANTKAVQHEVQSLSTQLHESEGPQGRAAAAQLRKVRQRLTELRLEPVQTGAEEAARRQQINQLEADDRHLTAQLRKLGNRTGRGTEWFELEAIRRSLPEGGVLIDIARHRFCDFGRSGQHRWSAPRYVAWVTPREGAVRVVDLGEASAIDALVAAVQKELPLAAELVRTKGEAEAEKRLLAKTRALGQRILEPLLALEEVAYASQWVISPDGNLWLVPWAALPLPTKGATRYVVEQHLLRFVTTGRDVAGRDVAQDPRSEEGLATSAPLIVADPDFDLRRGDAARLAQQIPGSVVSAQTRSVLSDGLKLGRVRRLPGTAAEAELIAPRIEKLSKRKPNVFLAAKAMEATVKAARRPQMLVISTHGFFLDEQDLRQQAAAEVRSVGGETSSASTLRKGGKLFEEPLLRCGLLLAACNDQPKPGETRPGDDGVLTGLEVMGLDLRGCELVVLSACETGQGDVRNGEGVAGLRQAFQLAGAESVLSSLWQVPDRETAQLMIGFFDKLSAGKDRATALAQTQRELIRRHRQRSDAAHPFFWAAFTLTGQDRQAR